MLVSGEHEVDDASQSGAELKEGQSSPPLASKKARAVHRLLKGLSRLPLLVAHWIGALAGLLLAILPSRHKRATWTNLKLCFPEKNVLTRTWWFVRSLQESAKNITELGHFWYRSPEDALGLIREIKGKALFDAALADDRPLIVGAPHMAGWELLSLYLSSRAPSGFLYREPRDAGFEALVRFHRQRMGGKLYRANAQGVRELIRCLQRGELIGMMPDHQPRRGQGLHVPFFGYSAYTMGLLAKLARKQNAQVLLAHAERLSWGRGFRLHFSEPSSAFFEGSPETSATALNADIERIVRSNILQYEWTYKRFSMQPEKSEFLYGSKKVHRTTETVVSWPKRHKS